MTSLPACSNWGADRISFSPSTDTMTVDEPPPSGTETIPPGPWPTTMVPSRQLAPNGNSGKLARTTGAPPEIGIFFNVTPADAVAGVAEPRRPAAAAAAADVGVKYA